MDLYDIGGIKVTGKLECKIELDREELRDALYRIVFTHGSKENPDNLINTHAYLITDDENNIYTYYSGTTTHHVCQDKELACIVNAANVIGHSTLITKDTVISKGNPW